MKSIAKLKNKARKHEQKEDWEAAIQAYQQVLDTQEAEENLEMELTLFNRIGDLSLRLGRTDDAVRYYETAADHYAEAGFYNNAIALCNKALRHRPERPGIYLKLSRLCNEQGFDTDARRWILEYAERQAAAGKADAALEALEESAELSNDPEVREMLAQQLASQDRPEDALQQLRAAYAQRLQAGQTAAAAAVAEKAQEIDSSVDLEAEGPVDVAEPATDEFKMEPPGELEETDEIGTAEPAAAEPEPAATLEEQLEPTAEADVDIEEAEAGTVEGLDTGAELETEAEAGDTLEGLESATADLTADEDAADQLAGLEVGFGEQAPAAEPEEAEADTLGELETFAPGPGEEEGAEAETPEEAVPDVPDAGADETTQDFDDEEEAEPLPLLGEEEAEDEEAEAEPLPALDGGFEDEPDLAASADEEVAEAGEELDLSAGLEEAAEAELKAGSEAEAMDLSLDAEAEGEPVPEPEPGDAEPAEVATLEAAEAATAETGAGVDLESFDLGLASEGEDAEPAVSVDDLDVDAIIKRSQELVGRDLTSEALQELHVFLGSDAGTDVFRSAIAIVNEIIRHDENDIAALKRRVEFAARIDEPDLLATAYVDLGDAVRRTGDDTQAEAMYRRALDADPDSQAAREALGEDAKEEEMVDLGTVLEEAEAGALEEPADEAAEDGDADFAAMLNQFKSKLTQDVDPGEAGDHYDLGLAFKDMGLIDEAIAEFQTALTGGEEGLRVYEELGQCFVQKNEYGMALKVFDRALKVPYSDESELLGVYYHMGQCHEELGQRQEAREAYEKVLAIDESFADVPDRMSRL